MSRIADALVDGTVRVLVLAGTDMTSSFADAGRVAEGLDRLDLVVSFDLFMNDTARRYAHIVLPGNRMGGGARGEGHQHPRVSHAEGRGAGGRVSLVDVDAA